MKNVENLSIPDKINIREQPNLLFVGLHIAQVLEWYKNRLLLFTIVKVQLLILHCHRKSSPHQHAYFNQMYMQKKKNILK